MGICRDAATTYLKNLGYNVVRHPREGIDPLQLIGKQKGTVLQLGGLDKLIANPPASLPAITRNQIAVDLSGQASSKLDLAVGINILGSFIKAMTGNNLGLKVSYQKADKIQFQFADVTTDSVVPLDVGNYLRQGDVDNDNLILEQYVLGNGTLYLITRTVKAKKFNVVAEKSNGTGVELEVPMIQGIVGGNLKVTADSARSAQITYEGPVSLTFGFQCFEVGVAGGELSLVSAKPGVVALKFRADGDVAEGRPAVVETDGLLTFD
jgi:hypothetical protein